MAMRRGTAIGMLAGLALLFATQSLAQDVLVDDFDGADFSAAGKLF